MAVLTGMIGYHQPIALPPDAWIAVYLYALVGVDPPATRIATLRFATNGHQAPFTFALEYDPAQIDARHIHIVRATIKVGRKLLFTTTRRYAVLTRGNPAQVDLILTMAGTAPIQVPRPGVRRMGEG